MLFEAEEKTIEPQPVLLIHGRATPLALSTLLGELLPELAVYAGDEMSGPPFVRYLSMDDEAWEIAAGVPVRAPMQGEGRIEAAELPGGRVITTWHVGPYDQLGRTYEILEQWLAERGFEASGPPWEVYWSDPMQVEPPELRTEIIQPVKG